MNDADEIEAKPLSLTETLLISAGVLACSGVFFYLITRLVARLCYYF